MKKAATIIFYAAMFLGMCDYAAYSAVTIPSHHFFLVQQKSTVPPNTDTYVEKNMNQKEKEKTPDVPPVISDKDRADILSIQVQLASTVIQLQTLTAQRSQLAMQMTARINQVKEEMKLDAKKWDIDPQTVRVVPKR